MKRDPGDDADGHEKLVKELAAWLQERQIPATLAAVVLARLLGMIAGTVARDEPALWEGIDAVTSVVESQAEKSFLTGGSRT